MEQTTRIDWRLELGMGYGNRGDISVDEAVVDADREEWRCACVGTYRDA